MSYWQTHRCMFSDKGIPLCLYFQHHMHANHDSTADKHSHRHGNMNMAGGYAHSDYYFYFSCATFHVIDQRGHYLILSCLTGFSRRAPTHATAQAICVWSLASGIGSRGILCILYHFTHELWMLLELLGFQEPVSFIRTHLFGRYDICFVTLSNVPVSPLV